MHPASLGGTDVFAQASVLDLWDPDRSQTVTQRGQADTWEAFATTMQNRMRSLGANHGKGLRILTETVTSPTLAAQLQAMLRRLPNARWHKYEPINRDAIYDGTRLAFGQALDVLVRAVGPVQPVLPTLPHIESEVRARAANWRQAPRTLDS